MAFKKPNQGDIQDIAGYKPEVLTGNSLKITGSDNKIYDLDKLLANIRSNPNHPLLVQVNPSKNNFTEATYKKIINKMLEDNPTPSWYGEDGVDVDDEDFLEELTLYLDRYQTGSLFVETGEVAKISKTTMEDLLFGKRKNKSQQPVINSNKAPIIVTYLDDGDQTGLIVTHAHIIEPATEFSKWELVDYVAIPEIDIPIKKWVSGDNIVYTNDLDFITAKFYDGYAFVRGDEHPAPQLYTDIIVEELSNKLIENIDTKTYMIHVGDLESLEDFATFVVYTNYIDIIPEST